LEFVLSSKYDLLRSEQRKRLLYDAGQSGVVSASVEIVLDNEDGRFPINEPMVSIKRTIGAKKDEYFVNQRHSDKTELNNLLESAGISKYNQHFIVPQGSIAERVKERDNERLQLIKEIAGTRVYDERRNESLKLMNNADHKREKVNLIINYFQERLEELNSEKEELYKFQTLDTEKRSIEYQIYDKEKTLTQKLLNKLQQNELLKDEKNEQLHHELKGIKDEMEKLQTERNKIEKNLEKTRKENKKKRKDIQAISRLIVTLNQKKNELLENNKEFKGKKEKFSKNLNELNDEIKRKKADLNQINANFERMKAKELELRQKKDKNESILKDLYSKQAKLGHYKSKTERNNALKQNVKEHKKEMVEQEKLLKNINDSNKKIDAKLNGFSVKLKELERLQSSADSTLSNNEKLSKEYKKQRNALQNERKLVWKEESEIVDKLDDLKLLQEKNEKDFRFTMNFSMFSSYRNLKRIENDLSDKYKKVRDKMHGFVLDNFCVVNSKYNVAVEAAASNKLFYYLVETDETASELIKIMHRERINRVTFVCLNQCEHIKPRRYPTSADVIPIMKLLKYEQKYEKALIQIFGNTLVPQSIHIGFEYAMRENYQCVTLNGDIVTSGGAMDGGFNEDKYRRLNIYQNIVKIQENIKALKNNDYKEKLQDINQKLLAIDNKINNLNAVQNKLRNEMQGNKEKLIEIEEEIDIEEESKNKKLKIFEKHQANIERLESTINCLENEMKQPLKKKLSEEEQQKMEQLINDNEEITKKLRIEIEKMSDVEIEKLNFESLLREDLILRQKDLMQKIKKCNDFEFGLNEQALDQTNNKLMIETEKVNKFTKDLVVDDKNVNEWNLRLKNIEKELQKKSTREKDLLFEIEEHSINSEKLVGRHQAFQEKLNNLTKNIRLLGALNINNEHSKKYSKKSIDSLKKTLNKINKDLNKYKNVNKKALDQYNSFSKERQKLEKRNEQQLTDKDHIEKLMEHLDLKKDDAILRTFHAINDNFKKAFKSLVIKGSAKLMLFEHKKEEKEKEKENEKENISNIKRQKRRRRSSNLRKKRKSSIMIEDELEDKKYAGVGIQVAFGENNDDNKESEGERARSMRQLSGGQQTVVALSLIFAIQRCDPSPFYVFDEIDAALDQQYRKAVADIIKKEKQNTQFITTTFRPEILNEADKCFVVDFKAKISTIKQVDDPHSVDLTKFT